MKKRKGLWIFVVLALVGLLGACAVQQPGAPGPFQAQSLADGKWKPKADNLVFVLDASSSMASGHAGVEKFAAAKAVIARFNQTMPDLNIKAAIRTFGHDSALSRKNTMLAYGVTGYSRADLAAALDKIKPAGGPSPMDKALAALGDDFKETPGKIALIIVSDAKDMTQAPVKAASELKAQYGDRLCVYTVLVGDNPTGQQVMAALSQVTGCGQAVNADQLATPAQMADFVETVMLEALPEEPKPAPKPAPKVEMPPKSTRGTWVFNDIKFEFDKATLMDSSYPTLERIYGAMRDTPDLRVEIQGHTCSMGSDAYNMDLSQRRAHTVMEYLKEKGISGSRMTAIGFGESQPIDTNDTLAGRANNRRVELKELK